MRDRELHRIFNYQSFGCDLQTYYLEIRPQQPNEDKKHPKNEVMDRQHDTLSKEQTTNKKSTMEFHKKKQNGKERECLVIDKLVDGEREVEKELDIANCLKN